MSRTKRIYNRHPILGGPGLRGWLTSKDKSIRTLSLAGKTYQWAVADEDIGHDYVYRPYGTYCMGNCSTCKRLKAKRYQERRQSWKAECREAEKREFEDLPIEQSNYAIAHLIDAYLDLLYLAAADYGAD